MGDGGGAGIDQGGERDVADPVAEVGVDVGGDLDGEERLASAAGPFSVKTSVWAAQSGDDRRGLQDDVYAVAGTVRRG